MLKPSCLSVPRIRNDKCQQFYTFVAEPGRRPWPDRERRRAVAHAQELSVGEAPPTTEQVQRLRGRSGPAEAQGATDDRGGMAFKKIS